jgi:uncharacterized protein
MVPRTKLLVKKSKLIGAGLGLFTKVSIAKGTRITEYKGRLQPWREMKKADGHNGYLLRVNRSWVIDALPFKKSLSRYANDARGLIRVPGLQNNADYIVDGLRCYLEAKRSIRKGEEILVSYGREYWTLIRKIRKQQTLKDLTNRIKL